MKQNLTEQEQEQVVGGVYTFKVDPLNSEEDGAWVYVYKDGVFYCKEMYYSQGELGAIKNRYKFMEMDGN